VIRNSGIKETHRSIKNTFDVMINKIHDPLKKYFDDPSRNRNIFLSTPDRMKIKELIRKI
jgi:hypothetical protein